MIIGFDGKRAVANFTGLGNYSRFIIGALNKKFRNETYKIFAPKPKNNREFSELLGDNTSDLYPKNKIAKLLPSVWRSKGILKDLKKEKIEIFHGLSGELPFGISKTGIKSVVTIHDLIFRHYPQYYKTIDRTIYDYKFRRACKEADKIIAVSDCTKRDIISYYNIPEDKIVTVYQGCHPNFNATPNEALIEEVRKTYNLPKRYIACVGTIEERKNLLLVAKAMTYLPEDIYLIAVGRKTPYAKEVEDFCTQNGLTERVRIIEGVPFKFLPSIYHAAELFTYTSRFEGFGIPIVEAISAGLTGVAATGSCLEEAGGDGVVYVNPDSIEECAEALNKLLTDNTYKQNLITKGKEHIKKFSPDTIAEEVMKVYKEI
ncbi:MAG: glycosyltransferase family 4 protein [Muribaculaceae bacterium]|nr:glycosyltransferase family 4 protein [Muribaculaceae bacterium]